MRTNCWLAVTLCLFCTAVSIVGPKPAVALPRQSQPMLVADDPAASPSDDISAEQEQAMSEEIQRNIAMLRGAGALMAPNAAQTVSLNWPLRMAPGPADYAGFRVSAF